MLVFIVGYSHRNVLFCVHRNVNLSNVIHDIAVGRIERNYGNACGSGQRHATGFNAAYTYPQIANRPRGLARDQLPIAPVTVAS